MKARSLVKFVLAAGFALLLVWVMADQKTDAKGDAQLVSRVDSSSYAPHLSSDRSPATLRSTTDITFTSAFTVYLPIVSSPPPGIFGRVTYQGSAIGGISLTLQLWEAFSSVAVLTTTTQPDGRYLFTDVPGLEIGKSYVVRYMNSGDPRYLAYWYSDFLNSYTADTRAAGGDFDIANVVLISPRNGATIAVPYTFQWTPRPASPSDNYAVMLACRATGNRSFFSVGYTGSLYLSHSPGGCRDYWWLVTVTPEGLIFGSTGGVSYEHRAVSFSN